MFEDQDWDGIIRIGVRIINMIGLKITNRMKLRTRIRIEDLNQD